MLWIRRNNNNNQIWDDINLFLLLNQNSLCVWPSDDVAMLLVSCGILLSNCLFDVNVVVVVIILFIFHFSHHKFISLTTNPKEWNNFTKFLNKHLWIQYYFYFLTSAIFSNSRICYCNKINIHCPSRHWRKIK